MTDFHAGLPGNKCPNRVSAETGSLTAPESPEGRKSVLVVETERLPEMRRVIARILASPELENPVITVLCNEKRARYYTANPRVAEVLAYRGKGLYAKLKAASGMIFTRKKYDLAVAVLNGERHFSRSKILFWLLRARGRLIFDGKLRSFRLYPENIFRLFNRERKKTRKPGRIDVLLFETDRVDILRDVISITGAGHVVPGARISIFCRESSAPLLQTAPRVVKIISYRDHSPSDWFRKALPLITARKSVIAGVLNGRKRFYITKFLFFLCRNRHRLIFNGSLDCCFWNRHTWGRVIVQGLKTGVNSPYAVNPRTVLVLETAGIENMKKMIRTSAEPKVNPNARIILFCNESRKEKFRTLPEVMKIITYSDTSLRARLSAALGVVFCYPEVVAACFNGRPEFRPLKLLFWLVRAPSRIVFNESLDCYYLTWKNTGLLVTGRMPLFRGDFLVALLRMAAKVLLFPPRFAYLLAWRTFRITRFRMAGKTPD